MSAGASWDHARVTVAAKTATKKQLVEMGTSVQTGAAGGLVIEEVTAITPEIVAAMARLLPQLSPGALPLGLRELGEIVASPATTLLVARTRTEVGADGTVMGNPGASGSQAQVVGTVTLVAFRIPSGLRCRLESLVVDRSARGRGVAEGLCRAVLARAKDMGAITVDLTSSPTRSAANRLYQRLGFERRETNVYRVDL